MRQPHNGEHRIPYMANQWGEKFKQAAQAILPPARRLESPIEIVTLKQLTKGSGFGRAIQCVPGEVTVIHDATSNRAESFREAVLGKGSSSLVSVRVGVEELRRSEMYVVGANDFVWEAKTVFDALSRSGIPSASIAQLLEQVGLGHCSLLSPKSLEPNDLKKLSLVQSLYAKARLLVYDRPFSGIDAVSMNLIASLMLQMAVERRRVLLVLGEKELPSSWQNQSNVKIVVPERQKGNEELGMLDTTSENAKLAQLVKNLSGNTSQQNGLASATIGRSAVPQKPDDFLITRPQMIFEASRGKPVEFLRSETINNPHVPQAAPEAPKVRTPSRVQRQNSGSLTRVTWRKRAKRLATPEFLFRFAFRVFLITIVALVTALLRKLGVF